MKNSKDKILSSFWIPSKTPEAKESALKKPDKTIYCPISGNPLKVKNLIPIKFTQVQDPDDKKSLIVKQARYMCPITHDILGNSVPCAVIKTT
jgi:nitric oxide synthase-interacting protein